MFNTIHNEHSCYILQHLILIPWVLGTKPIDVGILGLVCKYSIYLKLNTSLGDLTPIIKSKQNPS